MKKNNHVKFEEYLENTGAIKRIDRSWFKGMTKEQREKIYNENLKTIKRTRIIKEVQKWVKQARKNSG